MVTGFFIGVTLLGFVMVVATIHRRLTYPIAVWRAGMMDWLGIVLLIIGAFGVGVVTGWPVA